MISVKDIAFVRYQATDLDLMEKFMLDFGLYRIERTDQVLYLRSSGTAHHCHITELGETNATLGFGLHAQSEADLHKLALEVNSTVEDNPEPGGGMRVRFRDPMGFLGCDPWPGNPARTSAPRASVDEPGHRSRALRQGGALEAAAFHGDAPGSCRAAGGGLSESAGLLHACAGLPPL